MSSNSTATQTKAVKDELGNTGVSYVRILSGVFLSNATYNTFIYLAPSDPRNQLIWTWAAGIFVGLLAVMYTLFSGTALRMRQKRQEKEAVMARLLDQTRAPSSHSYITSNKISEDG